MLNCHKKCFFVYFVGVEVMGLVTLELRVHTKKISLMVHWCVCVVRGGRIWTQFKHLNYEPLLNLMFHTKVSCHFYKTPIEIR